MKKILLHIGYPRCGSTSTQNYFNKLKFEDLTYFENKQIFFSDEYIKIKEKIFFLNNKDYDLSKNEIIDFFSRCMSNINIISDETFLYPTNYKLVDFERTLDRFLNIFTHLNCEILILINIRDPKILHISYFNEMYHRIIQHTKYIDTFDSYFKNYHNKIIKRIFDTFNFNEIFKKIIKLNNNFIPNKNIFIIPLENINEKLSQLMIHKLNLNSTKLNSYNLQVLNSSKKIKNSYIRNYDWSCFFLKYDPYHKIVPYKVQKFLKNTRLPNKIFFFKNILSKLDNDKIKFINNLYKNDLIEIEKKFHLNLKNYNYYY